MEQIPNFVKIVEVGPRDGLQNEAKRVPTELKIELINKLSATGLSTIEVTSFVSPKWIPQLQDSVEVYAKINKNPQIHYPVIVPNIHGLEDAIQANVTEVAVLTAASDTFNQKNINCSIKESLDIIEKIIEKATNHNIKVRGYISCTLGCPYEGNIAATSVLDIADILYQLGCYEISLGDTIGVGTPQKACKLIETVAKHIPINMLAGHFHDTYGQALANIYAVLQLGIAIFDSSIAGLGGCPYAKGASGNVATEDVVYMLHGMGIATNIDLNKLLETSRFVTKFVGHKTRSKVVEALIPQDYS
jgi:hydroxymethylglutaryl-CoA lyase